MLLGLPCLIWVLLLYLRQNNSVAITGRGFYSRVLSFGNKGGLSTFFFLALPHVKPALQQQGTLLI